MKNIPLFIGVLFFIMLYGCGSKKEASQVVSSEHTISESSVSETLQFLSSDALQGRQTGTPGIEKAALYIEDVFQKSGIKPFFSTYRDSFEVEGKTGYNLVGVKEGSDPVLKNEFVIIGAHYDHVGVKNSGSGDVIFNGANDNATGTTAVLELAKYFADKDLKRSVLFTLFSAEEMGLVGAKKLAQRLGEEDLDLYVMFNIEMVGVPMGNKEYLAYVTGYKRTNLAEKFNQFAGSEVLGYLPQAESYNLFKRSDNYPFFEQFHVPAQTISTFDFSNYDFYHKVEDEYQLMDIPHMKNLIKSLIPGLTQMVNSPEKQIKLLEE